MYLVFDTETTGKIKNFDLPISTSENFPRMVQLAWQLHDEDGKLIENKDYIIKPEGFDIPYITTRIHGITTELALQEGKDLGEVLVEFEEAVSKAKIGVGQNIEFDYKVVGAEFLRKNIKNSLQDLPQADTMVLSTDFCAIPMKNGKYKFPKLSEIYEKLYQKNFEEAHNAAADVNATAQVFFELLRQRIISAEQLNLDTSILEKFIKNHPKPITPFDIIIRKQVTLLKGKKKDEFEETAEIDLGNYFNFHNHSIFSSLQSSTKLQDLISTALENDFPAVGMVDLGNLMGAFKFISDVENTNKKIQENYQNYLDNKTKAEEKGENFSETEPRQKPLIPILGCEFYISDRPEQKQFTKDDPDRRTQVVLLAKNMNGYRNLSKLSSLGFLNGFYYGVPRISREMIAAHKEDIIALTSGIGGDIPDTILEYGEKKGEEIFKWWKDTFGDDFYVQIQNHGLDTEEHLNEVLLKLADRYEVKILAQNETYYTQKSDANIQDILFCIKDGEKISSEVGRGFGKRRGLPTQEYYIKNTDELKETFQSYPDAFETYQEFLKKFEPYSLKHEVLLPKFEIPKEFQDDEDLKDSGKRGENAYLKHLTYQGAAQRYPEITQEIRDRLDFELETIAKTGYPGYFLIVQDFCNEARKMGVWVGPGRGSAAGSAVAYCIGITNVDPIKYHLLFERFLNPERVSMPDIDIDFDDEGREKIIKWVIEKYGQMNVAQIITYSVLGGKSAIKDAGRVLDLSIPETNNIAKLIPGIPGMNIAKAFAKFEKLGAEDQSLVEEMKKILENPEDERYTVLSSAQKLEGCIRNTGIHACGVIIAPEDISNLVPITTAAKDSEILVSQFDNSVAENAGLLKMDFLGLRTLTILKDALKLIKEKHGIDIDLDKLSLEDETTFKLFQEGKTIGIFQYESPGMQKYMRELKPNNFADLIAMNALYRPGPIKYIPNFINRKHGVEKVEYDLDEMEEYLEETYGITVYQEQVMLLSQKLAGFSKGEADNLRKAMGKKQIDVLNKMYPKFIEGGKKNNLDPEKLEKIWNDWKAFAEYAFNKSHSTCYALIAYQTAFLKANYTAEFMASVMTNNINNTKQITLFMEDCRSMGIDVLGPDVNESQYQFSVNEKGQIRFGLGAIKGIGEGPSETIVNTRKQSPFKNIFDFFERVPFSQINKRVVESLAVAGAFDEIDQYHRAQYFSIDNSNRTTLERLLRYGQSFQDNKNEIENSLFADFADEVKIEQPKILSCPEWPNMHKLNKEREIIGFYLSAHPLDEFKYQFKFLQGVLSKKNILEEKNGELNETKKEVLENDATEDSLEELTMELDPDNTELLDEELFDDDKKQVEPKGNFNFLNLDEIDAYKESIAAQPPELFKNEKLSWKEKQALREKGKEYTVCGLITENTIRDADKSGKKIAFVTMEDYSGSYSFRLGDKEFMKFRDRIDVQRFLIFKIKFAKLDDGRVFVNVTNVFELSEAFDKFANSLTVVININDLRNSDLDIFKEILSAKEGKQKLNFYVKNPDDKSHIELYSLQNSVVINGELLTIFNDVNKYQVYLN